jgi:hypothetical protein
MTYQNIHHISAEIVKNSCHIILFPTKCKKRITKVSHSIKSFTKTLNILCARKQWVAVDLYVFCLAGETSKEKKFKIEKSKTGMDKSFSNSKITKYRIQTTIHWLLSVPKRTHGNNR